MKITLKNPWPLFTELDSEFPQMVKFKKEFLMEIKMVLGELYILMEMCMLEVLRMVKNTEMESFPNRGSHLKRATGNMTSSNTGVLPACMNKDRICIQTILLKQHR